MTNLDVQTVYALGCISFVIWGISMLKQDREHTHTHKIPTYCSHSFRPSACYFEKPATCSSTTGRHFFLRCVASGLQHSCGAVEGHVSGVFTCLTGGIIAVYHPRFQEHSLSYTHRKRSVCLCTFLCLIFQVLCMVWVCFVKDAACLSVSASTHLLPLFSLSVSSFHFPHR